MISTFNLLALGAEATWKPEKETSKVEKVEWVEEKGHIDNNEYDDSDYSDDDSYSSYSESDYDESTYFNEVWSF